MSILYQYIPPHRASVLIVFFHICHFTSTSATMRIILQVNWGSEKLNNLPQFSELGYSRAKFKPPASETEPSAWSITPELPRKWILHRGVERGEREGRRGKERRGGKDRERERDKKPMTTSTIRSLKLHRAKSISKHGWLWWKIKSRTEALPPVLFRWSLKEVK